MLAFVPSFLGTYRTFATTRQVSALSLPAQWGFGHLLAVSLRKVTAPVSVCSSEQLSEARTRLMELLGGPPESALWVPVPVGRSAGSAVVVLTGHSLPHPSLSPQPRAGLFAQLQRRFEIPLRVTVLGEDRAEIPRVSGGAQAHADTCDGAGWDASVPPSIGSHTRCGRFSRHRPPPRARSSRCRRPPEPPLPWGGSHSRRSRCRLRATPHPQGRTRPPL